MSKYGNVRTVVSGVQFDSKAEAARYMQLKQMEQDAIIRSLRVHPVFELAPVFTDNDGKKQSSIRYIADFSYDLGGVLFVEDVKGVVTAAFAIKAKLFRRKYPYVKFRIIKV